jgi:hypothetical protein
MYPAVRVQGGVFREARRYIGIANMIYLLPWSVSELLHAMMLFMSLSNLLFRWIFLKQGKAE